MGLLDLYQGAKRKISDYFQPTQNVRLRDVAREIVSPNTYKTVGKMAVDNLPRAMGGGLTEKLQNTDYFRPTDNVRFRDFAREVPAAMGEAVRAIPQNATRFAISAVEAPKSIRTQQATGKFYNTPFGRLNSFQSEAQNRVNRGDPLWKAIGNPALDTVLGAADIGPVANAAARSLSTAKRFVPNEVKSVAKDMLGKVTKQGIQYRPPTTESLPGRWVRQNVTKLTTVDGNIPIPKPPTGQRYIGGPFKTGVDPVTQSQTYGIHTERYLPGETVVRDNGMTPNSELMRGLTRPGMSIEDVSRKGLTVGSRVRSADRGNVGTISHIDDKGNALVVFRNKQNKTTASVRIPSEKLTSIGGKNVSQGNPSQFSSRVAAENGKAPVVGYRPVTDEGTLQKSTANAEMGFNFALKQARKGGAEGNATAMTLIDDAIKNEQWDTVDMLVKEFSPKFSKQGQEIQILSRWGRLTPSGAINYAQHIIDKVKQETGADLQLSNEVKKEIADLANQAMAAQEGTRERALAAAILMRKIAEQIPTSLGRKVSTVQTMMQLLNPKTAIRNVIGNAGFALGEAVSDAVATPIDIATSLVTGKRTKTLPSVGTLAKGFVKGGKEGFQEAKLGVDTKNLPSQFDMPNTPAFTGKFGSGLERLMSMELKAPDRAFYQSAYDDSLRQQMKLANVTQPTQEMMDIAHADGLYRTFQDESNAAKLFSYIKKGLNLGKDFGFGDIVLKYPKTPGNLLARAIDYSPAGYAKGIFELLRPAFGGQFNQKAFVEALSRGTVGSAGLVGMGAILGKLGLITGKPADDKDINNLQRSQGGGSYRFNLTGLKRYVLSGFDPQEAKQQEGDAMMTYDWLQPFAVPLSMGANAVQKKKQSYSSVASESIAAGVDTLANQPLVQGMKRMFGYGDVTGGVVETAKSAPSSFIPTFLSQIRQYSDNAKRQLSGGGFGSELYASIANKVPGLESTLPQAYDTQGRPMEMYQNGGNTLFNVFFNPAFLSQIETTPGGKEVMDIYNRSGETQQAPRTAPAKLKINGVDMELTADQISQYQKYIGERTGKAFDQLATDARFQQLPDEEKAKYMANVMTDIATAAKGELFGNKTQDWRENKAAQYTSGDGDYNFQFNNTKRNEAVKNAKSNMASYKKLGDVESWKKEAEKLYQEYTKAYFSGELTDTEKLKVEADMKVLEGQFAKYKGYNGFTKPKKGKKGKKAPLNPVDSPSVIVKMLESKFSPKKPTIAKAFTPVRTGNRVTKVTRRLGRRII